jgi:predicted kinase
MTRSAIGRTVLQQGRKVYLDAETIRENARKAARRRLTEVGDRVLYAIRREYVTANATVTMGATTSDQPLIRIEFPDGKTYHCTIAKARK